MDILCTLNNALCEYNGILTVIFCLTILTFLISVYTCFIKCKRIQKDIDVANKTVNNFDFNQKEISVVLDKIDKKITNIEKRLENLN